MKNQTFRKIEIKVFKYLLQEDIFKGHVKIALWKLKNNKFDK